MADLKLSISDRKDYSFLFYSGVLLGPYLCSQTEKQNYNFDLNKKQLTSTNEKPQLILE